LQRQIPAGKIRLKGEGFVLTRLRVQGFKSLLDVEVLFGPFTCFIGPNAAGKSNIFDAIRFLSLLAEKPIMEAVAQLRESTGRSLDPKRLFTLFGNYVSPTLRLEADMIVEPQVEDDFGVTAEASKSVLRYAIKFQLDERESPSRLQLVEESLDPILKEDALATNLFATSKIFVDKYLRHGRRTKSYISVDSGEIGMHQDKRHGRLMKVPARRATRTALSGVNTSEYPTVLAAKKEMLSWRTFMLEPTAMRAPSTYRDSDRIDARGANLPAAVNRLQRQEENQGQVCAELANRLSELVDDIRNIRVLDDPKTETLTLEAEDSGNVYHPARSLSDGTLRFLALSVLSMDPLVQGLICLEEPENGIHPNRIKAMVRLLRDIAVDPSEPLGQDNPVRQVAVNTHSPHVVNECDPNDVIYVDNEEMELEGSIGQITVTRVPSLSWRRSKSKVRSEQSKVRSEQLLLAIGQLQAYMPEEALSTAWQQLYLSFTDHL